MATAPSTSNYTIPKGSVHFTPTGGTRTHLGNCFNFTYTPAVTKKDHFQSMSGIRSKDLSVVTQLDATIKMSLDEINEFNLALFLLAETGTASMGGLTNTQLKGKLEFTGANAIGNLMTFTGQVQMQPGGDMSLVTDTDDFQLIPLNAEVLLDAGSYGVWTVEAQPTA
jgi:hypothetical protein